MGFLCTAVAQLGNVVGDIQGNAERVAEAMRWAERASADVLVLPELVLTGYPVADLVLHREFVAEAEEAVASLGEESGDTVTGPVRTVHTRPLPEREALPSSRPTALSSDLAQVWDALVTGTRDFGAKNGFTRAVLGLSGGIDAAVTAAVAADAFAPERCWGWPCRR